MSDKRRNINAQKIEAQKRLYRSSKRPETTDMSELDKRRAHIEKRREELVCTKYRSWSYLIKGVTINLMIAFCKS